MTRLIHPTTQTSTTRRTTDGDHPGGDRLPAPPARHLISLPQRRERTSVCPWEEYPPREKGERRRPRLLSPAHAAWHNPHTHTQPPPPFSNLHIQDDDPIHQMVPNVSIGSMSLSAAHSGRAFDTATDSSSAAATTSIPSTVEEGQVTGPGLEDDGHVETVMIRTATNTIEADTPRHRHHHGHRHGKKGGGNGRTFNDLFSPLEAERAAKTPEPGDVEAGGQASR